MPAMSSYSLDCKKNPKDLRDIPMGLVLPAIPVPKSLDYGPAMSLVRDQGDEGTCVLRCLEWNRPDRKTQCPGKEVQVLCGLPGIFPGKY